MHLRIFRTHSNTTHALCGGYGHYAIFSSADGDGACAILNYQSRMIHHLEGLWWHRERHDPPVHCHYNESGDHERCYKQPAQPANNDAEDSSCCDEYAQQDNKQKRPLYTTLSRRPWVDLLASPGPHILCIETCIAFCIWTFFIFLLRWRLPLPLFTWISINLLSRGRCVFLWTLDTFLTLHTHSLIFLKEALHPCGEKGGKPPVLFERVGASPTPTKACFPRKDAEP